MKIFVTGGAGYIGSHTSHLLQASGHKVFIYDNLSSGRRESLPEGAELIKGDIRDKQTLISSMASIKPDAVIHFAALVEVEESVSEPLKYYENNFFGSLNILEACKSQNVKRFVFSSTAAVYGEQPPKAVLETASKKPLNPYGQSKLMTEKMLQDVAFANPEFRYVILRYFNVAGAQVLKNGHASLKIGQFRERATHLVTLAARAAAGAVPNIKIFGTDYPTEDGTCIRDYIHVDDLASAHLKALEYLESGRPSEIFNCGYGVGYSVKQVIRAMKEVTGVDFEVHLTDRRAGDSSYLVANSEKAQKQLSWIPRFNDINLICRTAYDWELKRLQLKL